MTSLQFSDPSQPEKLEALVRLTGNLAHDFANVLLSILLNMNLVDKRNANPALDRPLAGVRRAAERGLALTQQLLACAGEQHLAFEPADLNALLLGLRQTLEEVAGPRVTVAFELDPDLWPTRIDSRQIEQAVMDLARNARDAMEGVGRLTLQTRNVHLSEGPVPGGDYVALSIADTGCGMSDAVLAQACEPYFTTKTSGEGRGLGLSAVMGIARQHQGGIQLRNRCDGGITVDLFLPRLAMRDRTEAPAGRKQSVLIIDDDPELLDAAADALSSYGFAVLSAAKAPEALEIVRSEAPIDLLLVDYHMGGLDIIRQARQVRPGLPVLVMTGYVEPKLAINADAVPILKKPLRAHEFADHIKRMIEGRPGVFPRAKSGIP